MAGVDNKQYIKSVSVSAANSKAKQKEIEDSQELSNSKSVSFLEPGKMHQLLHFLIL